MFKKNPVKKFLEHYWFEAIFFVILFFFSWWLMWHTFGYKNDTLYIATKAWSDFSANIPLIRSFSWGQNFPPQDPLFGGEPNHYHFLFYLLVGTLERLGLPLDFALNLPSTLGFFALLMAIYILGKTFFKSRFVAFFGVVFLLFNGSLSFLEFFKIHPLSWQTPKEILSNEVFPSFGPYDGKTVSAFWNLNIYTNQRHLAAAFALILMILFLTIKPEIEGRKISLKKAILCGFLLALLPFFHSIGFGMALVTLSTIFLIFPNQRRPLFITLTIGFLVGLPQLLLMQPGGAGTNFKFNPGYLIADQFTLLSFFYYWSVNLGLGFLLIPLGFILGSRFTQKIFLVFIPFFIIGNLFQFSPEMAANHKFFNLFIVIGNLYIAFGVAKIWDKKNWGKILAPTLIFFLTLSGIIDFFPIKNDSFILIPDAPKSRDIAWIKENTPPKAVFLNSSYLYHPASLAGRPIFLGWPYFPWAGGLDASGRDETRKKILGAATANKSLVCQSLKTNNVWFVSLGQNDPLEFTPNFLFWKNNFFEVYHNPNTGLIIYDVNKSCL